jgi:hypothetical protein
LTWSKRQSGSGHETSGSDIEDDELDLKRRNKTWQKEEGDGSGNNIRISSGEQTWQRKGALVLEMTSGPGQGGADKH